MSEQMSNHVLEPMLSQGLTQLGVEITEVAKHKLSLYQNLLSKWAPKINLVGDADASETVGRHFLDSLACLRLLDGRVSSLADIGAGAGFPGFVLAIARPDWQVTLLEPNGKRASFLLALRAHCGADNVEIIARRSSDLQGQIHHALCSRATFPVPAWIAEGGRLAIEGGFVLVMTASGETDAEKQAAAAAGLERFATDSYELFWGPRVNLLYRKRGLKSEAEHAGGQGRTGLR